MSNLFNSDSETEVDIRTDNSYAKHYCSWRQKEELNKLKTKYGDVSDPSESSSSSSDDDEDAMHVTEETERNFFKTLARLKTKDPKIYDQNITFFSERSNTGIKKLKKNNKPIFIHDYERNLLLENKDQINDTEKETNEFPNSMTYVQEQEKIKRNLQDALQDVDDDDDENDWGGMFKSRQKTETELKKEEEDYKQWLKGQKEDISDEIKNDLKPLKDYWCDPNLDEGEKFLRDYILNKRFLEPEDTNYIPSYDEIIHDSDDGLSDDEKQVEKQEEFEHKYNYRFEEPDEEFIKRYPRTIESSLRRKDDKRKTKRAETKERKQKEKREKMEEIKQMQILKKKEIEEKIKKLKEVTGNAEITFEDKDIEEDFDPEAHDKRMQRIFSDNFYQCPEEEQKPEFPNLDEELGLENWEKYDTQEDIEGIIDEPHCEDEDFNMDCDYDPVANGTSKTSDGKKKRKRRTKFAEILREPKPTFNPDNKTYQEYLDEYYKLECEDVIGDIPCRFKYRKVVPNSFGLTIEEILMANERELNRWCSLKKAVQYRPEHVEKYDVIAFDRKGKNEVLKRRLIPSLFKEEVVTTPPVTSKQTSKKRDMEHCNLTKRTKKHDITIENQLCTNENLIPSSEGTTKVNVNEENTLSAFTFMYSSAPNLSINQTDAECNHTSNVTGNITKKKNKKKRKSNIPKGECMSINCNESEPKQSSRDQYIKRKTKPQQNDSKQINFSKKKNPEDISNARLKAFGFKPKKFKNKVMYGQSR